jgi:hypothetical protein
VIRCRLSSVFGLENPIEIMCVMFFKKKYLFKYFSFIHFPCMLKLAHRAGVMVLSVQCQLLQFLYIVNILSFISLSTVLLNVSLSLRLALLPDDGVR